MRRLYLVGGLCALLAMLATQPVLAEKNAPNSPKFCEVSNAAVDLEASPPTLLLEGSFCKSGMEPSAWISKDGTPTPVSVLSSGDTSILLDVTGFESVQAARAWVVCGTGALASGCSMDLTVNKVDADDDPTNEIQQIERVGVEVCLLDPDGGCANIEDADADPDNELQQLSKAGSTVSLSRGGGSFTDEVDDADSDPTNEYQTLAFDPDTRDLSISNGNSVHIPPPASEVSTGVEFASGNQDAALTLSPQIVRSITITAPSDGYIATFASGYFDFTLSDDFARCSITMGTSVDFSHLIIAREGTIPDTAGGQTYVPFGATRVFTVGEGDHMINLVCEIAVIGTVQPVFAGDTSLTGLFVKNRL